MNKPYQVESVVYHTEETKGPVLACVQFPHPGDKHLFSVLVQLDEYVVWDFNAEAEGFYNGHYFGCIGFDPTTACGSMTYKCKQAAYKEFAERIRRHAEMF